MANKAKSGAFTNPRPGDSEPGVDQEGIVLMGPATQFVVAGNFISGNFHDGILLEKGALGLIYQNYIRRNGYDNGMVGYTGKGITSYHRGDTSVRWDVPNNQLSYVGLCREAQAVIEEKHGEYGSDPVLWENGAWFTAANNIVRNNSGPGVLVRGFLKPTNAPWSQFPALNDPQEIIHNVIDSNQSGIIIADRKYTFTPTNGVSVTVPDTIMYGSTAIAVANNLVITNINQGIVVDRDIEFKASAHGIDLSNNNSWGNNGNFQVHADAPQAPNSYCSGYIHCFELDWSVNPGNFSGYNPSQDPPYYTSITPIKLASNSVPVGIFNGDWPFSQSTVKEWADRFESDFCAVKFVLGFDADYCWQQISGNLVNVSVASDGSVWGVNSNNNIYRYAPQNAPGGSYPWELIQGSLKQISVGNAQNVWGVNSLGKIYCYDPGITPYPWRLAPNPGSFKFVHVSVSAAGTVWAVYEDGKTYQYSQTSCSSSGSWQLKSQPSPHIVQLSVGNATNIWAVADNGSIYKWNSSSWVSVPGSLKQVAVGADGTVWGVNNNNYVYRYFPEHNPDGSPWIRAWPSTFTRTQISVGNSDKVWAVDSSGNIFKRYSLLP